MQPQEILSASTLDILFDGRNKNYGAYLLRKNYNHRLSTALTVTMTMIVVMFLLHRLKGTDDTSVSAPPKVISEVTIREQPKPDPLPVVQKPLPRPVPPPSVRVRQYSGPPIIVKEATADEQPPDMSDLEHARIGLITDNGVPDEGITAPPQGNGNGVTAIAASEPKESDVFGPVEIESSFPGGIEAWKRFLQRTTHYPADARNNLIQGKLLVRFVVDVDGTVSNVEVVSGPPELREEAIRVIKKSGRWVPAIQNGRKVKSYKQQPIIFQLADE